MFYVGQKVVCVDDVPLPGYKQHWDAPIFKGRVYTIAAFATGSAGLAGAHLVEVRRPSGVPFHLGRFRPLTDQKKSVSFTAGAPDDSERWDNRRKVVEHAAALRAIEAHRGQG